MNGLSRLPDEWYEVDGGPVVPWMVWTFEKRLSATTDNVEFLRHFLRANVQKATPLGAAELVVSIFNVVALHLQTGESHALRAWLARLCQRQDVTGPRYPYLDEQAASEAGRHAWRIVSSLLAHRHENLDAFLRNAEELIAGAAKRVVTVAPKDGATRLLIEALERGIPLRRVSASMPLYRLGLGCRQQSLWRGFTAYTSHIGTVAATHKSVANELLRSVGLPVPRQRQVGDAASAKQAAAQIGFPVVVKPAATDFGTAVTTDVRNEAELLAAFAAARRHGAVLVEEQLPGSDYRLVVVNGRFVSAIRRDPAQIIGDGVSSVVTLVARLGVERRADPELAPYGSPALADPLVRETLRRQGLVDDSIPAPGQTVLLRTNANTSTGGSFANVTVDVHPDNALLAERAAACLGLDHAGIDLITPDIRQPWHSIECGICEINPTPGMNSSAIQSLLAYLFPAGSNGRIPVVVVVGEAATATAVFEAAEEPGCHKGRVLGTVLDGIAKVGGQRACRDERPTAALLDAVLADTSVGYVVAQVTSEEVLRFGLRLSHCDLAVFLAGQDVRQTVSASPRTSLGRARLTLVDPTPSALRDALGAL